MVMKHFGFALLTALPHFLRLESEELRRVDKIQFESEGRVDRNTYDFVIVGGGTAGCVLAGRLSKKFNVLLLEAGGEPPTAVTVPGFYGYVSESPNINYFYKTTSGLGDAQGKMLGGSGSHNAINYNRGHPRDYDNWAKLTRDPNWSYKSLLKYFKQAETYRGLWPNKDQRGESGFNRVETSIRPIYSVWTQAAGELGYKVRDPNGPQMEGFGPLDLTHENGRRVSTYTAYVQPVTWRSTLTVFKYAFVQKVLFRHKRAIGVQYVRHGRTLEVFATKEVMLSAGSYSSPVILMRSGIGPKDQLSATNIKLRHELPVGRNLQNDYGKLLGPFHVVDQSKLASIYKNLTKEVFEDYLHHQKEIVLSEGGFGPQAFLVSPEAIKRGEPDWPDLRLLIAGCGNAAQEAKNIMCMEILIGRSGLPKESLGSVTLNTSAYLEGSTDNAQLAVIDYKLFQSEREQRILQYGMNRVLKIFATKAFKKIGVSDIREPVCTKRHPYGSDAYWNCYIWQAPTVMYHPAGTCGMSYGKEDENAVVDSKLRVFGFKGLRIVDASIMPQITNANINAAVIVIAEKAADDILTEYENVSKETEST